MFSLKVTLSLDLELLCEGVSEVLIKVKVRLASTLGAHSFGLGPKPGANGFLIESEGRVD